MELVQAIEQVAAHHAAPQEMFTKIEGAAPYKGSGWGSALRIEKGISLEAAQQIALTDERTIDGEDQPRPVAYFMYVNADMLILEVPQEAFNPDFNPVDKHNDPLELAQVWGRGYARIFHRGDTVFFYREDKWLGDAGPFADTYVVNR